MAGYIGYRDQSHVLGNTKVSQVDGLCKNEHMLCDRVLNLAELVAKVLDKDFLEPRSTLHGLFADELEALILGGKNLLRDESPCFQGFLYVWFPRLLAEFLIELYATFCALPEVAKQPDEKFLGILNLL